MNRNNVGGLSSLPTTRIIFTYAFFVVSIFISPNLPVVAAESDSIILHTGKKPAAELYEFNAPLRPSQEYYFFELDVSATDQSINLLTDFSDPFIFISGHFFLFDWFSPLRIEAIAASWQGQIPIAVDYSEALVSVESPFTAHLYLDGEIPLDPFPMFFDGTLGFNVNPDGDNDALLDEQQIVGNGDIDIDANLCGLDTVDFSVGPATVSIDSEDGETIANVIGRLMPNSFPLDLDIPINISDLLDSFLVSMQVHELDPNACLIDVSGSFTVNSNALGSSLGLPLNDLVVTDGRLKIDRTGVHLRGNTSSNLHNLILFENSMGVEIFISNSNPLLNRASLRGNTTIGGVRLGSEALIEITSTALNISGVFQTPIQSLPMSGSLTGGNISMSGTLDLSIPIYGPSLIPTQVTNGAICGYNQITSALICGSDLVASLAHCGVTSVTDAAQCGWKNVTDGATCGFSSVCNLLGVCEPNTCQVAKTCNVPAICDVPRTCNNLNSPLTCITNIEVITQQGSLAANMTLTLTQLGLDGSLSGQYCTGDICFPELTDSIKFGSEPMACANITSKLGGCVQF